MKKCILIPARLNSSRLKNKLLLKIKNKTIIQINYLNCLKSNVDKVYVITNSLEIKKNIEEINGNVIFINKEYNNGTERIGDAIKLIEKYDIYINVQGDQVYINPVHINYGINKYLNYNYDNNYKYLTLYHKINYEDNDKNKVKLVVNNSNSIMYFSRNNIPSFINNKPSQLNISIGIYFFTFNSLLNYINLVQQNNQNYENIEQLKIIENSHIIKGYEVKQLEKFDFIDLNTKKDYEILIS